MSGHSPKSENAELTRLRAALTREERISSALREVGVALGTTLDLDDLLELILGRLTDLLDAARATLYLVDEAHGDLVSRVTIGTRVRSIRVKLGHGIAGTVAKTGKPIRVVDAYKDPRFEPEWDLLTGYRTTCMLAAPLKNHLGRTIGVIQVLNKAAGEFNDEDEAILTALSTQAAVAIDNSRLFLSLIQKNRQLLDTKEQLERKVSDLELLYELERATSQSPSFDGLVLALLSSTSRACQARGVVLAVAFDDSLELVQYVYDDQTPDKVSRISVKYGDGLLASSVNQGSLKVLRATEDPRYSVSAEGRYPFPVQSILAVRLDGEERALGAIGVFSKNGNREFDAGDESLLRMVGANASTALQLFLAKEERERGARLTSIGRLLSQVIHDFKTPLTVISGYVQLMQNEPDAKVRVDQGQKALKQFDVLASMQREVLEFARGERTIFVRRVYLNKFFSEFRQQLAHEVDGRAIELVMDIDRKVVARFDEGRVARALQNLTRNAVEAMAGAGGTLTIEARMDGDDLFIAVSDTGSGIPEEIRGRLFQSFVTSGKQDGTGLGLAIVRKTVDEHGGRVEAISTPHGARFEMRFPQNVPPPAPRRAVSKSLPPPPPDAALAE